MTVINQYIIQLAETKAEPQKQLQSERTGVFWNWALTHKNTWCLKAAQTNCPIHLLGHRLQQQFDLLLSPLIEDGYIAATLFVDCFDCYIGAFECCWLQCLLCRWLIIGTWGSRRPHLPAMSGVTQHEPPGGRGHPRGGQAVGLHLARYMRLSRSYMAITPAVPSGSGRGLRWRRTDSRHGR